MLISDIVGIMRMIEITGGKDTEAEECCKQL